MRRSVALVVSCALLTAACGGTDQTAEVTSAATETTAVETTAVTTAATTTTTATTVATVAGGFPVNVAGTEIPDRPEAIISMSSTSTEMLFAIGAGDQVIAVDSFSDHPPEAPVTDLSAFEPSVEAVAALEPDLVVIFHDPGSFTSGLEALEIPVIRHVAATNIEDSYAQLRELGAATGHVGEAEALIEDMSASISQLVDSYRIPDGSLTYYHEVDNTLFSATSNTFIGSIYGLFGLRNIADPADGNGSGFPQLSEEFIIESDPDLIFYGCAVWCGTSAESIAERPGWERITAVESGALFELDDDIISRWGPRLVDFVGLIGDSLAGMEEAAA